ncbi:MAG: LysR substrate-binding domain-containing protein [Bradymonadia bacterium]
MDDIEHLLAFRDVVECGGFARAARRRGTAHSTISRQVRELEARLGVPLMTRTTRSRHLTAAGELVFRHSKAIGDQLSEMLNALEQTEQNIEGVLRVSALVHVGAALVMPAVERFTAAHERVEVQLEFHDGPLEFHKRGLDLALTVGLPQSSQLVVKKLCDNPVVLVAAPSLVRRAEAALGALQHPSGLHDWPLVAYRNGEVQVVEWPYVDGDEIRTLTVKPGVTVSDGVSLLDAVRRGVGVGYLSRFSVIDALSSGALVQLLPEVALPDYAPVYVARADLGVVSPRVRAFEACLAEVAASLEG